jgi:hypothetical protein
MNNSDENTVLITWKGNEESVFVLYLDRICQVLNGCAVLWAPKGTLNFRFMVNGYGVVAEHYPVIIQNGRLYNTIYVDELPEEFSQMKFLTVKEIEIIDEEVFGSSLNENEQSLNFQKSGQKILALLKMNVERRRFKKIIRKIKLIQKKVREFLMSRKIKVIRKRLPIIRYAKVKVSIIKCKKILPRIVKKFYEFSNNGLARRHLII